MDVSVVVPVYNTSRYLRQCVDSLINQTLKNVEFIFVDDGSTDDSVEILKEYQKKDERIKILQQENLYAGVARNNGMRHATGKYIIFLDSDDFFELTLLEQAFRCAEDNRAEIVLFGYNRYDTQTGISTPYEAISSLPDMVFSVESVDARLDDRFFSKCCAAPWNKLYLRGFIEKHCLRFQNVRKCNDTYFVLTSLILAERIKYLDRSLVNYRTKNPNSLQGNKGANRESYIDCGVSVKKKATELDKYNGIVKASLCSYTIGLVRLGIDGKIQYEEYSRYYDYVKQHLIPDLFDSPEDFHQNPLVTDFYRSRDFTEYLFMRMKATEDRLRTEYVSKQNTEDRLRTEYVSKQNTDYRIGHAILRIPRWVKRFLRPMHQKFAGKKQEDDRKM